MTKSLASDGSKSDTSMTVGLNVAVVISDEIVRCGLAAMLRNLDGVRDVVEYGDVSGLADLCAQDKIDVMVVSSGDHPRAAEDAHRHRLMLLVVLEDQDRCVMPAGAIGHGYVRRQGLTVAALGEILSQLNDDRVIMPRELARSLFFMAARAIPEADAGTERPARPARWDVLTAREREALELLAAGMINKQIARHLRISEHGAKRLVASLLMKLRVPNRTQAVATALREGLLEGPRRAAGAT
jgi:two-component system, NarL family, nitrate/nitrite response regulator NarL